MDIEQIKLYSPTEAKKLKISEITYTYTENYKDTKNLYKRGKSGLRIPYKTIECKPYWNKGWDLKIIYDGKKFVIVHVTKELLEDTKLCRRYVRQNFRDASRFFEEQYKNQQKEKVNELV